MTDIFCLTDSNGRLLDPSVQSTILAKYSRSKLSAREILQQLTTEEANKFHEKWVVGYGHSSVRELAYIPVCFEGISIVASKFIEKWQRPGYSEKSTRYQQFSKESFITPPTAPDDLKEFAARFYESYDKLYEKMIKICAAKMDKDPNDPQTLKDSTVKARTFDNVRYLLPAGTGTNVACVINLRDVRDMIVELRSHQNSEFKMIGNKLFDAVNEIAPVLVRNAEPNDFQFPIIGTGELLPGFWDNPKPYVRMHRPHLMPSPDLEQAAFESLVFDFHHISWTEFENKMQQRPDYSEVPDIFKSIKISFEIMMDYGAFRDLQRHRRCEQYVEPLTSIYGYVIPDDIASDNSASSEYQNAMEQVNNYNNELVTNDIYMNQYIIPLGYLHRSIFQMDLKELYYIIELRTKPQGHISYRKIAYDMYKLALLRWPKLMQWCRAIEPITIGTHT